MPERPWEDAVSLVCPGEWLMNTRFTVSRLLDNAIAKVGQSEFDRITDGMSPIEKLRWVNDARDSLDLLRCLESPDYADPMVALLYIARYQLSHINLAFSTLKAVQCQSGSSGRMLTNTGRLHVVDFGCGALAMQFGVALAVADALEQGQVISEVRIDSIDTSRPMLDLGVRIWVEFRRLASKDVRLEALKTACSLIQEHYSVHTDHHSVQKNCPAPIAGSAQCTLSTRAIGGMLETPCPAYSK